MRLDRLPLARIARPAQGVAQLSLDRRSAGCQDADAAPCLAAGRRERVVQQGGSQKAPLPLFATVMGRILLGAAVLLIAVFLIVLVVHTLA